MLKYVLALIYLAASILLSPGLYAAADDRSTSGKVFGAREVGLPDWFKDSFLDVTEDVQEATGQGRHLIPTVIIERSPCATTLRGRIHHRNSTSVT
jgi:hypothetical protein